MAKKKGLWSNIHAKRKRGESPAKKGDKNYPETLDIGEGAERLDEISKKLARSYVDKATADRDKNAKDWMSTGSGEAFNKAEDREKNIQRATSKLYKGTPAGKIMGTKNPAKVSATGKDPAEPKEKSKGIKGLVKKLTRKEEFVNEGKSFAEFCYEAYDKPEEKLVTDRNMFSIPKADQKSAEERLMAKAKAKREEKAKMKKESVEILDVDGNMVAEITDLISPEPMTGWKQQMDEAAWTRKEGKNKAGGLNEKGRKSYERENPGSDLKAPQPEGGPRKKSFCARMGGMKGPLKDEKGEPTRKKLALDKWKC